MSATNDSNNTHPGVTSAVYTIPLNTTSLLNVNMTNVVKLTATNYLVWSRLSPCTNGWI